MLDRAIAVVPPVKPGQAPRKRESMLDRAIAVIPRSSRGQAPCKRESMPVRAIAVIPAEAGIHGLECRLPSGPAVAAPVNR